jgi:RNA polymerase sigma-70 factor (ECF subfamily)
MAVTLPESVRMTRPVPRFRSSPARDERRLARRLRGRDPDALREVYDRYGSPVFGFLVGLLGDRATAEDIQQQVFLEVWQRAGAYDPRRAAMLTWILVIARSRAIDHLRRQIPEPRDPTGSIALLEEPGADEVDALLEHWRVAHLLTRLPDEEADVLRRRFYGDRSQSEIADDTGVPLGTVKSRMATGLRRLRAELEGQEL